MYAERGDFVMCCKCEEFELVFVGEWYWDCDEEQVYCDKCWIEGFDEKRRSKNLGSR